MRKCPECHNLISNELRSCDKCGYPYMEKEPVVETKECPECKNIVEITVDVCDRCG